MKNIIKGILIGMVCFVIGFVVCYQVIVLTTEFTVHPDNTITLNILGQDNDYE